MNYNRDKLDEMVLGLLHLTTFKDSQGHRAWKGHDWETLDRLHAKGFIENPKSKSRSVGLTAEGKRRSEEFFSRYFG